MAHHLFVRWGGMAAAATLVVLAAPVAAQEQRAADQPAPLPLIQQLYDCRAIADPAERLACFDRQVAAVAAAEAARDIRIVDREAVRATRRGLFGFSLGRLNIFGDGDDEVEDEGQDGSEAVTEITATITQFARNDLGKLVFVLDNGQRWIQTDNITGRRDPRVGHSVTIRRAALGSFIASVEGRPGIRVRREQ